MDADDEILNAFKIASKKGRTMISTEALLFLTDIPEHEIHEKLRSLSKYGLVKPVKPTKAPKNFWMLDNSG